MKMEKIHENMHVSCISPFSAYFSPHDIIVEMGPFLTFSSLFSRRFICVSTSLPKLHRVSSVGTLP